MYFGASFGRLGWSVGGRVLTLSKTNNATTRTRLMLTQQLIYFGSFVFWLFNFNWIFLQPPGSVLFSAHFPGWLSPTALFRAKINAILAEINLTAPSLSGSSIYTNLVFASHLTTRCCCLLVRFNSCFSSALSRHFCVDVGYQMRFSF